MPETETCPAVSTYGQSGSEWTYHCTSPAGHESGQHTYALDDGQTPPPAPTEESQ